VDFDVHTVFPVEPEVEVQEGTKMMNPSGGLKDGTTQKLYLCKKT